MSTPLNEIVQKPSLTELLGELPAVESAGRHAAALDAQRDRGSGSGGWRKGDWLRHRRFAPALPPAPGTAGAGSGTAFRPSPEEGAPRRSSLRRGRHFNAEEFRERIRGEPEKSRARNGKGHRRRSGYGGARTRDHGEMVARRLLKAGLAAAGLRPPDLLKVELRDWPKRVVDRLAHKRTVVPVAWIRPNAGDGPPQRSRVVDPPTRLTRPWGKEWREARRLLPKLE